MMRIHILSRCDERRNHPTRGGYPENPKMAQTQSTIQIRPSSGWISGMRLPCRSNELNDFLQRTFQSLKRLQRCPTRIYKQTTHPLQSNFSYHMNNSGFILSGTLLLGRADVCEGCFQILTVPSRYKSRAIASLALILAGLAAIWPKLVLVEVVEEAVAIRCSTGSSCLSLQQRISSPSGLTLSMAAIRR